MWFSLISAGGFWCEVRECSKDSSHLVQHLSYSPETGEDAAGGSFCQLLNLAAHYLVHLFVFSNKCLQVMCWVDKRNTAMVSIFPKDCSDQ